MFSLLSKRYLLPILGAILSFALFQLALHHPVDARAFSSLEIPWILPANEFDGVYTHLFARLCASIFSSPELSFRILTALATGSSIYFIQKLFPHQEKWSIGYVVANVSFLYFAVHSPHAMMIVLLFSAYLSTWEGEKATRLPMAGLLGSLMLGLDSLLAVALILYALGRVAGAKESAMTKLVAFAAILLGITVWVLSGYMLYASPGFSIALAAGFHHLFAQINPINFAAGLLVTFNVLLISIFRSSSETTNIKYLGSLLIVLFLFIKVEPIHLVLLLILGVSYLCKTSELPKQRWVLPIYAVLNIASFFFLPSVQPLAAKYDLRAERPSQAEAYYASYFSTNMLAYQSLLVKSEMLQTSRGFVMEKSNVPVILDPATEFAFDRAALRATGSRRMIAGFDMSSRRFRTVFGNDTAMMQPREGSPSVQYLATNVLPLTIDSLLEAINAPRIDRGGLRYYTIDSSRISEFFDTYLYHHHLSYH